MTPPRRIVRRTLIGTVAATLLYLGPAAAITPASAHVQATSTDAARGAFATVSFQVPNESTTNAATTEITVVLTNVSAVQTEAKPSNESEPRARKFAHRAANSAQSKRDWM